MKTIVGWSEKEVQETLDPSKRRAQIARLEKRLPICNGIMYAFMAFYGILLVAMFVTDSDASLGPSIMPGLLLWVIVSYRGAQRLVQLKIEDRREECEQIAAPLPSEGAPSEGR